MRQNFDDEETGFDMRDVAGTETVANENELLNDYTIKDADAGSMIPPCWRMTTLPLQSPLLTK